MNLYHFTRQAKYPMLLTPVQVLISAPDQATAEDMCDREAHEEYTFDWNIKLIGSSYIEQQVIYVETRMY